MRNKSYFDSEEQAALSFQRGEERGFEHFYKKLSSSLIFYAMTFLFDEPAAKDMVANSFIKCWENKATMHHHKQIRSWLYTTTRNDCLNYLINRDRKEKLAVAYNILFPFITEGIDHNMIKAEVLSEIYSCAKALPKKCKSIFELMYKEGLTTAEVSKKLNLSVSTVKNQKSIAIKKIRSMLSDDPNLLSLF